MDFSSEILALAGNLLIFLAALGVWVWSLRPPPEARGPRRRLAGAAAVVGCVFLVFQFPNHYLLVSVLREAPARVLWMTRSEIYGTQDLSDGAPKDLFGGGAQRAVRVYVPGARVHQQGEDLVVSARLIEVLKGSAEFSDIELRSVFASVHRQVFPWGRGARRGYRLDRLASAKPTSATGSLTNAHPFVAVHGGDFIIPGGAKLCQPECRVTLVVLCSSEGVETRIFDSGNALFKAKPIPL